MRNVFLSIMIAGALIAACGSLDVQVPTSTAVPSPTSAPVRSEPALIKEIELETESGTSYTLAWSPDGETLAVASGFEITLLSSDLNETQALLKPEGGALGVAWSTDKTQFATVKGYQNPTITLWNWNSAKNQLTRVHEIEAGSDQYFVSWSPDEKMLATLGDDQTSVIQI